VEGEVDADTGMVIEFAEIDAVVNPLLVEELDHRYLNDIPGLENPTAEHLARWIWSRLCHELPMLTAVEVQETASCAVVYEGS
jgi:6-pyruvoyltetrahydropterin/6-carboxytetrahydropterin synthase